MTQILSVRRRPMLVVAGAVCLATALGAGLRIWSGQQHESAIAENPTVTVSGTDEAAAFENATGSVSWRLESLSPQYLFPSTPKSDRTASITAGRLDPYAPLSQGRPVSRPQTTPAAAISTTPPPVSTLPVAAAPTALPPIPTSTQPLAPLPPPLPVATTAPLPVAAPVTANPIDSLELTGVVQVGDRPALIVREPNATTSRYTYAGDYLAGQILVKRIDVSNQEPFVILEYNGREYSRMVGSGPIASLP